MILKGEIFYNFIKYNIEKKDINEFNTIFSNLTLNEISERCYELIDNFCNNVEIKPNLIQAHFNLYISKGKIFFKNNINNNKIS
jgi:hypothetical protein